MHLPRVRLDSRADKDIINWLTDLQGYGSKSQAIREAIRCSISQTTSLPTPATHQPTYSPPSPADYNELLGDIRRVMDASLESALANLSLTTSQPGIEGGTHQMDDDFADFASLMLSDEEEQ